MIEDEKLPITGFGDEKVSQFGLREIPIMEPKSHRMRAVDVANKLLYAYEVGATMKDLDSVVAMWTSCVEAALINTDTLARIEEREACAKIADAYHQNCSEHCSPRHSGIQIADAIRARGNKK